MNDIKPKSDKKMDNIIIFLLVFIFLPYGIINAQLYMNNGLEWTPLGISIGVFYGAVLILLALSLYTIMIYATRVILNNRSD